MINLYFTFNNFKFHATLLDLPQEKPILRNNTSPLSHSLSGTPFCAPTAALSTFSTDHACGAKKLL